MITNIIDTIKYFFTKDEMDSYISSKTTKLTEKANVVYYVNEECKSYVKEIEPDYLWIEAIEDNCNIRFNYSNRLSKVPVIFYSYDKKTWSEFTKTTHVNLLSGQKIYIKGQNDFLTENEFEGSGFAIDNGKCNIGGSISTLMKPSATITPWCFGYLFAYCNIVDASQLVLPYEQLSEYCYASMFEECQYLINMPALPATTLAEGCYYKMFLYCQDLTNIRNLPATTLASYCYASMFDSCVSLTSAPELPATTLADYCYYCMFYGCASLTSVPELPVTALAESCYEYMFSGCTSLTSAPALPATTLVKDCYYRMFNGCTSLISAPELPATILAEGCYEYMFKNCTSLNYIKCLATNIDANDSTLDWLSNVSLDGTFVKASSMTSWPTGSNGIPTGWTVEDA